MCHLKLRQWFKKAILFVQHGLSATWRHSDPRSFIKRGPLTIPLQDRVFQLWWHILLSPQTELAWGATPGHAIANYPSETWRESLNCITCAHTESTDTFNESKEVLLTFTLLLNFIWILKKMKNLTLGEQGRSMTEGPEVWNCSDLNIQMHRHISSSHLYACCADVCLIRYLWENSSDQWSRW